MSSFTPSYSYIVVGAGINGTCTAYHLAKMGHSVLLIDQVRAHSQSNGYILKLNASNFTFERLLNGPNLDNYSP